MDYLKVQAFAVLSNQMKGRLVMAQYYSDNTLRGFTSYVDEIS
jgi:hypothetical protein